MKEQLEKLLAGAKAAYEDLKPRCCVILGLFFLVAVVGTGLVLMR